jgi:hypothetical protein
MASLDIGNLVVIPIPSSPEVLWVVAEIVLHVRHQCLLTFVGTLVVLITFGSREVVPNAIMYFIELESQSFPLWLIVDIEAEKWAR